MIPIRDENPTHRIPWITLLFIAANVAVFIYELTLDPVALDALWTRWAFVPGRFGADPFSVEQILTLFTAMFMHAGWVHAIGNLLYLWIFGNNIEDRFGPVGFVAFYLTCGVAASLAQWLADPGSMVPMIGASGAVAGVLGAYILLFPGASVVTLIPVFVFIEVARVPAYLVIGFWFILQLGNGLVSLSADAAAAGGVAYFAHIGGFGAGLVLALPAALAARSRRRARASARTR
ncbi:MAG: rhomboid family intramembrane serine protease [Coriobacteriia bacterium]|nr:rhomboid family intramembrane serine protease [Coriobacteriia bacterium]